MTGYGEEGIFGYYLRLLHACSFQEWKGKGARGELSFPALKSRFFPALIENKKGGGRLLRPPPPHCLWNGKKTSIDEVLKAEQMRGISKRLRPNLKLPIL